MENDVVMVAWLDLNTGRKSAVVMRRGDILAYRAAGMAAGLDLMCQGVME